MHDFILKHANNRTKLIIEGDFNLPHINWSNSHDQHVELLLSIAFSAGIVQVVTENSRISDKEGSILDLILLNTTDLKYSVSIHEGISDHKLVFLSCLVPCCKNKHDVNRVVFKDYLHSEDESVIDYLERSLDEFAKQRNINELWNSFKTIIAYCEDNFIPTRTKKKKSETRGKLEILFTSNVN